MKNLILLNLVILFTILSCKKEEKKESISPSKSEVTALKSSVKITAINHGTLILEYGDAVVYIDPVGGIETFKNQKKATLIVVTDIHGDHFNIETIKNIKAPLLAPKAVIDKIIDTVGMNNTVINNGESETLMFGNTNITIEAIPMYNLREEALKFHPKGRGNGYVLTLGKERIYISGDTEDIPEMRALKNIDRAFICMNLPYTMTVESAASAVLEFKPKHVFPYHYRGAKGLSNVNKFKTIVNKGNPSIDVIQLDWYPNQ